MGGPGGMCGGGSQTVGLGERGMQSQYLRPLRCGGDVLGVWVCERLVAHPTKAKALSLCNLHQNFLNGKKGGKNNKTRAFYQAHTLFSFGDCSTGVWGGALSAQYIITLGRQLANPGLVTRPGY